MDADRLKELTDQVRARGPHRVVINDEGEAVPQRAEAAKGITVDVVFIREDGWTLGAANALAGVAEDQWSDRWIAFMRRDDGWKVQRI